MMMSLHHDELSKPDDGSFSPAAGCVSLVCVGVRREVGEYTRMTMKRRKMSLLLLRMGNKVSPEVIEATSTSGPLGLRNTWIKPAGGSRSTWKNLKYGFKVLTLEVVFHMAYEVT